MTRQKVTSSNFRSAGYDPETNTLELEYIRSGVYQYFNVPEEKFAALMAAPSKGRYFHYHLKDRYRFRKVQ